MAIAASRMGDFSFISSRLRAASSSARGIGVTHRAYPRERRAFSAFATITCASASSESLRMVSGVGFFEDDFGLAIYEVGATKVR